MIGQHGVNVRLHAQVVPVNDTEHVQIQLLNIMVPSAKGRICCQSHVIHISVQVSIQQILHEPGLNVLSESCNTHFCPSKYTTIIVNLGAIMF
jgi:hypothetical protein